MAIKWVPDLGAPIVVAAADLLTEKYAASYRKWVTGILAVGGYVGSYMNFGGDFVKNVGIAALPTFARNIYDMFNKTTTTSRNVSFHRTSVPVTRYPTPVLEPQFSDARLV